MTNAPVYPGQLGLSTATSQHNIDYFRIQQQLARVRTMQLVEVVAATSTGQVAPAGFLNVTLLINQIDSIGNSTPHQTIFQVPYLRLQGGANAVIMDPQVGDIGWCGFADRDISAIVRSRITNNFPFLGALVNRFNPASYRKFDLADAVYIGGVLNGTPSQYMTFSSAGINVTSPTAITLNAPSITMTAPNITMAASTEIVLNTPTTQIDGNLTSGAGSGNTATFNGSISATGQVTGNGIPLSTHIHTGVQSGSSDTGGPIV